MSSTYYSMASSRRDTPTDASTQTRELVNSIIYDESMVSEDDGVIEESDDEENKPTYLKRNKNTGPDDTSDRQRQMTQALLRGNTTYESPREEEKRWRPKKLDYNNWRKTNIDQAYGTFYSYKQETIATPDELPVIPSTYREPAEGHLFGGIDFYHMREKSYIKRISQTLQSPYPGKSERKRFSQHIIQEYKRPLKDLKSNGYGAPQRVVLNQTYNDVNDVIDTFLKPNNGYNVMPKRQNPEKCDRPNQLACEFCDVLGPGSCAMCIEATNRRIAHDVEEAAFPALDCSATSLVAPSLSKAISTYERKLRKSQLSTYDPRQVTREYVPKGKTTFALPPIISQRTPEVRAAHQRKIKENKKVSGILKKERANRLVLPAISPSRSPTKGTIANLGSFTVEKANTIKPHWKEMQGV